MNNNGSNRSAFSNIEAFVKGTLSGDTLIVTHPKKLPPVEKVISLANIRCPQMGKSNQDVVEEPFAFAAREHVRKQCIGKMVTLSLQYTNPKTRRDYCKITSGNVDLGLSLLKNGLGWINYKKPQTQTQEKDEYDLAEDEAKENELGVWGEKAQLDENARDVFWKGFDVVKIFKTYQKKQIQVIVEYVVTGSQLKVLLPTNDIVTLLLTGVQCSGFKYVDVKEKKKKVEEKEEGKKEEGEKKEGEKKEGEKKEERQRKKRVPTGDWSEQARHFTESRLLNRDVTLILEGVDLYDNLYGTILVKHKPFQIDLLTEGLAKISEWNASQTQYVKKLRNAQLKAIVNQVRIWKNFKPQESSLKKTDKKLIPVQMIELLSADTIKVLNTHTKKEERFSLSSIRAKRMGFGKRRKPEPFAYEGREFLRKKLAGKKLTVKIDYRRTFVNNKKDEKKKDEKKKDEKKKDEKKKDEKKKDGKKEGKKDERKRDEERVFVTLFANGRNISVDLVNAGLASVSKHRTGEERSSYYDKLMAAEIDAKRKQKGIHRANTKNADIYRINDITFGEKTEQYFSHLKDRRMKGIVEKVHSGTRMKVWVEKQSLLITFALSGISSPSVIKTLKPGEKQRPFSLEAKEFTNKKLILQEVEILVDFCDKFGTFLGNLWINGKNYSVQLLENGFAYTNGSARRLDNFEELSTAEKVAKAAKKNLMSMSEQERDPRGFQRKQERTTQRNIEREQRTPKTSLVQSQNRSPLNIRVTEVIDCTHIYLQTSTSENIIGDIEQRILELDLEKSPDGFNPRSGDIVLCQYSDDNAWYRGKVLSANANKFKVFYIDYGNTEIVELDSLRPCSDKKLISIPVQAKEAFLAWIDIAPKHYRRIAEEYVRGFLFDQDLSAIHEYTDKKNVYLTIFDNTKKNLNKELIRRGLAFVTKNEQIQKSRTNSMKEYSVAEQYAINKRNYLWEKGEIYGGEDEETF